MLIIAPIYKVKPLKDVKLFPYVRISRNLALVSASRQEINQAFDHFYAKYIEDDSTISSADPRGLKTDLAFQVKCINIATRNNFLINLLQWVFFRLIRKNLVSNLLDFRFKNTGYDLAGNHIDKQYDRSLPPYVFSSKIKLPFEKFKFLSKASIRFDNKLFIFRKPEPAEKIKSIKENKTLYVAALGVSNS